MFVINLPKTLKIGNTVACRINKQPARITWRDTDTLVIEPDDVRAILAYQIQIDCIRFACGDRGVSADGYRVVETRDGSLVVFTKQPD